MNKFPKQERLTSQREIALLFSRKCSRSVSIYPLRLVWCESIYDLHPEIPIKVGFIIPKKRIKKAVLRNKIKRRIKEAYRHMKPELYAFLKQKELHISMVIIYTGSSPEDYHSIHEKLTQLIQKLQAAV